MGTRNSLDWADLAAVAALARTPTEYGLSEPVKFVLLTAGLEQSVFNRLSFLSQKLRLVGAFREKCRRMRATIRLLKEQVLRLQMGNTIETDFITDHQLRQQAVIDKLRSDVEKVTAAIVAMASIPVLGLDPGNRVEVAWACIGVQAGIISEGKARELLGGVDIERWRSMAMVGDEALDVLVEAIDGDD